MEKAAAVCIKFEWDMGHRLPNHKGACSQLHGHRYVAQVMLAGPIKTQHRASDEGMVIDFQDVKRVVKGYIDLCFDHKFLVADSDPYRDTLEPLPGVIIVPYIPTAENIAWHLCQHLREKYFDNIVSVVLNETPTAYAEVQ